MNMWHNYSRGKNVIMKKTGTCLLKAPNILLYFFVSIKSLLSTTLLTSSVLAFSDDATTQKHVF